jgi:methyl-accepting chemotaxis protein
MDAANQEPLTSQARSNAESDIQALRDQLEFYRAVMRRTADVCEAAAQGDLEARVHDYEHPGDVGRMMQAVNLILDVSDAFVRESMAALEHANARQFYRRILLRGMPGSYRHAAKVLNHATNDLAQQSRELEKARQEQLRLADQFEHAITGVVAVLATSATEMQATASTLSSTAKVTNDRAASVTSAARQTTTRIQTVASATEQLTSSMSEIGRQLGDSDEMTARVKVDTHHADRTISKVAEASKQIGRITNLITQLAAQSKLLALNATIEAVHAGKAGSGFAVVASEVKALADSTARATEEIASHITGVQGATDNAVTAIAGIARLIDELKNTSTVITNTVREQRQATSEIASHVNQVASSTDEVTHNMEEVSSTVDQTSRGAEQLLHVAADISRQSEGLSAAVQEFLRTIRRE